MKSLTTMLTMVRDELNKIEDASFYHYKRPENVTSGYGVWAETGEAESFNSDNRKSEQQLTGYLDYYTLNEFDPVLDQIQDALSRLSCGAWSLNSVQYEDETNLIHYEWSFNVV